MRIAQDLMFISAQYKDIGTSSLIMLLLLKFISFVLAIFQFQQVHSNCFWIMVISLKHAACQSKHLLFSCAVEDLGICLPRKLKKADTTALMFQADALDMRAATFW